MNASSHKKVAIKKCRRCGKPFQSTFHLEVLCQKCQHTLPKCGSCHTIMAPEYGYMEGFARKVGIYKICDWCSAELRRKKFLHISESQYLLPSGRVKVRNVPAEDKG